MEVYKILSQIMESKNLSIADVARISGLPDSTVRGIIKREQKTIALDVAFKLSDGLGVSLEQLNGEPIESTKKSPSTANAALGGDPEVDSLRTTLLHNFDQLNQEGQERLVETSDDMVCSGKYIKSASAGLGKEA